MLYTVKSVFSVLSTFISLVDVGSDGFSTQKFYKASVDAYNGNGTIYGHISLSFMLISVLINVITAISYVTRDTKRPILTKIGLVLLHLIGSPCISTFYLVKASHRLLTGNETQDSTDEHVDLIKLIEALAEAFPQAAFQLYIILEHGDTEWWQYLGLCSSLLSLAFTVATNQYLFGNADILSRVVFFIIGLVNATARLMVCAYVIPGLVMLSTAILIWIVKRCCFCCWANPNWGCLPLSADHRRIHHVVINWILMCVYNCFTGTGLIFSFLNVNMSLIDWLKQFYFADLNIQSNPRLIIYAYVSLALSLFSFVAHLILVLVPKFRNRIENAWLNISEQNNDTKLY